MKPYKKLFFIFFLLFFSLTITSCNKNADFSIEQSILNDLLQNNSELLEKNYPDLYFEYVSLSHSKNVSSDSIKNAISYINSILKYSDSDFIVFKDSNLESLIKKSLGLNDNAVLTDDILDSVTSLNIIQDDSSIISSIEDLKYFKNLNTLQIKNCNISDYNIIGYLDKLVSLSIISDSKDNQIDYSFLNKLNNLSILTINDLSIQNFDFLINLNDLYSFTSDIPVNDFSALSFTTFISELHLNGIHLSDFTIFSSYKNLKNLSIHNGIIDSFYGCNMITSLTSLDLSGSELSKIDYLIECKNITTIDLNSCNLFDVSFLSNIPLKYIDLSNNNISQFIFNNDSIIDLNLSHNTLKKIDLSNQQNITSLDLSDNILTDIIFNGSLNNITYIDVSGNQLTSLNFVSAPNLLSFFASDNFFKKVDFLAGSTALQYVSLDGNPVSNLDVLSECNLFSLSVKNTKVKSYVFLNSSTKLDYLNIAETWPTDLSFLYSCRKITTLYINLYYVSDYSPLASIESIRNLYVKNASNAIWEYVLNYKDIENIEFNKSVFNYLEIHDLPLLKSLKIINCRDLSDITMLYDLPSLSELYFEYVNIFNPYIADFLRLEKLSIIDGNVETVENINNLPACTYINLSENEEIDNMYFNLLPSLNTVILSDCSLSASSLANLFVSLNNGYLDLSNNAITNLKSYNKEIFGVVTLNISNNKIKDFSPIYPLQITNVIADGNRGKYLPQ